MSGNMSATRMKLLVGVVVLSLCGLAESDIFYDVLNKDEPCENVCDNTYPTTPTTSGYANVKFSTCCRRGCRFFNLVHLVSDKASSDVNATRAGCEASCMEAYSHTKERYACNIGCGAMARRQRHQQQPVVSQISWSVFVEEGNSVLVIQPVDFEPDDVLTDPGLRRQLERDFGLRGDDNKLPETHIHSLNGADKSLDPLRRPNAADWLDCASRRSGLPRAVLTGIVVSAVLLALWLCVAPDRHSVKVVTIDDAATAAKYVSFDDDEFGDPEVKVATLDDLPPKYTPRATEEV